MTADVALEIPASPRSQPVPPRWPLIARVCHRAVRLLRWTDRAWLRSMLAGAGAGRADQVSTWTSPTELKALFDLAFACPPGAKALEIGSYLGASTCYLGAGLHYRGGALTCVDTWQNQTMPEGERDTFVDFQKNVAGVRQLLRIVRKRTEDLSDSDIAGPFHLIFLDGDHSYEATRRDFNLIAPRVASEGTVAFHDCLYYEGVSRVLGEILAAGAWQLGGIVENLVWIRRAKWAHPMANA